MFIVFEGIDGSGKSTQQQLLCQWLQGVHNIDPAVMRDPGSTPLGLDLRQLLQFASYTINPLSELLLFEAARRQMVESTIEPALAEGRIVLCDRFTMSTTAYQGYGRGLDLFLIEQLNNHVTGQLTPVTIVFKIDPKLALSRIEKATRIESLGEDFFTRVALGYDQLSKTTPNVYVVDGSKDIKSVHTEVVSIFKSCYENF